MMFCTSPLRPPFAFELPEAGPPRLAVVKNGSGRSADAAKDGGFRHVISRVMGHRPYTACVVLSDHLDLQ